MVGWLAPGSMPVCWGCVGPARERVYASCALYAGHPRGALPVCGPCGELAREQLRRMGGLLARARRARPLALVRRLPAGRRLRRMTGMSPAPCMCLVCPCATSCVWGAFLPLCGWLQRETPKQMVQTIQVIQMLRQGSSRSHLLHGRGMVSLPWGFSVRASWRRFDGEASNPMAETDDKRRPRNNPLSSFWAT